MNLLNLTLILRIGFKKSNKTTKLNSVQYKYDVNGYCTGWPWIVSQGTPLVYHLPIRFIFTEIFFLFLFEKMFFFSLIFIQITKVEVGLGNTERWRCLWWFWDLWRNFQGRYKWPQQKTSSKRTVQILIVKRVATTIRRKGEFIII